MCGKLYDKGAKVNMDSRDTKEFYDKRKVIIDSQDTKEFYDKRKMNINQRPAPNIKRSGVQDRILIGIGVVLTFLGVILVLGMLGSCSSPPPPTLKEQWNAVMFTAYKNNNIGKNFEEQDKGESLVLYPEVGSCILTEEK
tara:strand:+ start:294 stop:713 length:420 start_codon:yes stop_codon:yes gene_type:complete